MASLNFHPRGSSSTIEEIEKMQEIWSRAILAGDMGHSFKIFTPAERILLQRQFFDKWPIGTMCVRIAR